MSENQQQLHQTLWNIANDLRGNMDADDFRDYILGFIFYKYLSRKMTLHANKALAPDGLTYDQVMGHEQEEALIDALRTDALDAMDDCPLRRLWNCLASWQNVVILVVSINLYLKIYKKYSLA